ncbi:DNA-processing protein DprA [Streptomyces sp. NPDC014733]|uniref:DNA-processing protein DprA n=1 Tax=Streptomyces sp. NPDC014733 TaxID=3364885 RepID=UPI0037006D5F
MTTPQPPHRPHRPAAGEPRTPGTTTPEPAPPPPDRPTPERTARAALSRIIEPGDPRTGRWLRELGPVALWHALTGEGPPPTGASRTALDGLRLRAARADPTADLATAAALGARFLCPGDDEWPGQLDDLGDTRPLGLWVRGNANLRLWALRSVALVGARACTEYGAHLAATLGAGLADRGWTVVSGAAYGIDGAAHRGTLAAGGATLAVLACGIDRAYPAGHTELIDRIVQQGLIVGELPPGAHPTRSRFIQRNRVIAALTRGTVVIEAALRSGSLVTARRAQSLGRLTMGVPGPVTSALSAGVHELLRGEAMVVTSADEVVEHAGAIGDLAPEPRGPVLARDLLEPATARVLEAIPPRGRAALTDIARESGLAPDTTHSKLHELCTLGYVRRSGTHWEFVRRGAPERSRRGGT